jgi:glycosyltransferase involved in cell wall biosynthesis
MIALHTMTKNGLAKLPSLFASVRGFADKAIILDTGSTDGTLGWLQEQRILPCEFQQCDFVDFGTTRTLGMNFARDKADWLLLLDDDMRLRFDYSIDEVKQSIDPLATAYLLQVDQAVTYWNTRLVSGHQPWEYKGVTHEYLDRTAGSPQLHGLMVEHHYNHGPEKFERDLRLLSADIARDPYDARTIFYLAQTLRDSGHIIPAIRYYKLRAMMGGWDEEVYYALYEAARLAGDQHAMLKVHGIRPTRAEAARWLEEYYKLDGNEELTKYWGEVRASIPFPKDILFIDTTAYGHHT